MLWPVNPSTCWSGRWTMTCSIGAASAPLRTATPPMPRPKGLDVSLNISANPPRPIVGSASADRLPALFVRFKNKPANNRSAEADPTRHFRKSTFRLRVFLRAGFVAGERVPGERRDDPIHMHVAVLDEHAVLVLRPADGRAGDVDAGDVRLHRALVEHRRPAVAADLDAGEL